ncbi:MAG: 16S rRNA (cytosine(967)-C(5))-methyltransferase RsmB [Faecousia sp.]
MTGARETALQALMACRKEGAWANAVLKEYIARNRLDSRDAALATRLCYGVLQNRLRLDYFLEGLLSRPLTQLHPVVRDVLHLGLYQLYDLDKIPASAAVNESVALAKKYVGNPKAPALVNAVLRSAQRSGKGAEPTSYALRYSHPEELIALLKGSLPKGTLEPMLKADNEAPRTVVQANTLKITPADLKQRLEAEGAEVTCHPWMEDALVIGGMGSLERLPSFREGLYYVQDPAARLSVLCAQLPKEGAKVLDCCAAPGGKSFAAAIAMEGKGEITSCDIHEHKIPLIENGAKRLRLPNIRALEQDASRYVPQWEGKMDFVIADVPCSGLGIIRKKPDIRYKNLSETETLPQLQLEILRNQARYVRPGGVLLYSTCTVLKRENEEVAAAFLRENGEFFPEPLALPKCFPQNDTGMLTLIPGQYDTDGFFICRLRRKP